MKNIKNNVLMAILLLSAIVSYAQNTDNAKDLNKIEQEKIKALDIKDKSNFNPNGKKIDTSNLDIFSTKPVVKGSKSTEKPKDIPAKVIIPQKAAVVSEPVKPMIKESSKPEKKNEDFSTQPIVKGKSINVNTNVKSKTPGLKMDTTKNIKEFTFETSPIIGNSASYNRINEPMPKSKEQIEEEIPVNRKSNNTNVNVNTAFLKEAYARYDREADSLHTANKRKLDSIMKSLNIEVPVVINPTDFIDIYVKGGGVILNADSKLSDNIAILHTGVIQREYNTKNDGIQRAEKKISKDELTKLAQYIVDMGFFDFKDDYDCADNDAACNARLTKAPQPVPLQISLIVGQQKNKVNVAIYAPRSEKNWVNYPATLEKIMNAIYAIVEK